MNPPIKIPRSAPGQGVKCLDLEGVYLQMVFTDYSNSLCIHHFGPCQGTKIVKKLNTTAIYLS